MFPYKDELCFAEAIDNIVFQAALLVFATVGFFDSFRKSGRCDSI